MTITHAQDPGGGRIEAGAHLLPLRVYYEDTDAGGIVYHASYLRFMERGRTELLRAAGIDQRVTMEQGTGQYAVARMAIDFRRPARLDDALDVVTTVTAVRAAAVVVQQTVMRADEVLAAAEVTVAFIGADGRPRRQPARWADRFREWMGEEGTTWKR